MVAATLSSKVRTLLIKAQTPAARHLPIEVTVCKKHRLRLPSPPHTAYIVCIGAFSDGKSSLKCAGPSYDSRRTSLNLSIQASFASRKVACTAPGARQVRTFDSL